MTNIHVGNLAQSNTEAELRSLFAVHGMVENVSIISDRESGRSRGFAFVEMTNWGEAHKAMAALNGAEFGGRTLSVNEGKRPNGQPRSNGTQRLCSVPGAGSGTTD